MDSRFHGNDKRAQNDTLIAEYVYDCFGRRIEKSVDGTTTKFYYEGASVKVRGIDPGGTTTGREIIGVPSYLDPEGRENIIPTSEMPCK